MTEPTEQAPMRGAEAEPGRVTALSPMPQARLDKNFYHAVDHLRTAVEGMDIVMYGLDLDRTMLAENSSDDEVRRRWAAHLVILRNIFRDVDRRVQHLHRDVQQLFAND